MDCSRDGQRSLSFGGGVCRAKPERVWAVKISITWIAAKSRRECGGRQQQDHWAALWVCRPVATVGQPLSLLWLQEAGGLFSSTSHTFEAMQGHSARHGTLPRANAVWEEV